MLCGCGAKSQPATVAAPHVAHRRAPVGATAPSPLRRLTNEEYNNTIRDLLGDTSRPADAFPPDEAVGGFENNTVSPITQSLVERYMATAESLAASAAPRVDQLAPCPSGQPTDTCARSFIEAFGRLAFRRPLDERERSSMFDLYTSKEKRAGYARAVQLVIQALLQSPQFLYRVEPLPDGDAAPRALSGYEVATRLSFLIWASTPDAALLDDAGAGRLATADDVAKAARRLLRDPRAVDGVKSFHRQWLDLRELDTESKDAVLYPTFTPELRRAMVEETLRFSAHVALAGGDAVTALLTSKKTFVNSALAKLYGVEPPRGDGFVLVDLPGDQRAGLLTQASVMTVFSHAEESSPILRGKFVREKLLCQAVPPPPPNVAISLPKFDPTLTKRERFDRHRMDPNCAGCHRMMDPIGFAFEHYDALGAWRTVDGAFPVDALGELTQTGDTDGAFDGAVALGVKLAASQRVRRCVATQWFRAALGRNERQEDGSSLDGAYRAFQLGGYDVRELIVAIASSHSFRHIGFDATGAP